MDNEKALRLAERVLNLSEVLGCGIIDSVTGEKVVYVGDFLESDWCIADLWGSLAAVIVGKLGQHLNMSMVQNDLYKTVILPMGADYLAAKIASHDQAWLIAAKIEPLVRAMR